MPDQDLEYRVKLDTTDLSSQLAQVRSQIDQALATTAFNSTVGPAQPQSFQFPMPNFSAVSTAQQQIQQDFTNISTGMAMASNSASNLAQATSLGFQKFNNDIRTKLLSNVETPMLMGASGGLYPDMSSRGFMANALTSFGGFGFDPTKYSTTPGEYRRSATLELGKEMPPMAMSLAGDLIGGTMGGAAGKAAGALIGKSFGAPLGVVGMFAGSYVGGKMGELGYDAAAATIWGDFTAANDIRDNAYNTSWRFLSGKFDRKAATTIGDKLATAHRDPALVGYEVSRDDTKRMMAEFTSMGGFDTVRSTGEYEARSKEMIGNVRKLMQTLKVTEEEALKAIKEFNIMGVGTNLSGMAMFTAGAAYTAGYTSREMMQFGQQSSELVRGSGISMTGAFFGGVNALTQVKGQFAANQISPELIKQYGGVENYAQTVTKMGYEWASSLSGYTQFAAASATGDFAGTLNLTPGQTIGRAVGYLGGKGIQGMLEYQGSQAERISKQDPMAMTAMRAFDFVKELEMLGTKGADINESSYTGYLQTKYGMGVNESRTLWNTMWAGKTAAGTSEALYKNQVKQAVDMIPTTGSILKDVIGNNVESALNSPWTAGLTGAVVGGGTVMAASALTGLFASVATAGISGAAFGSIIPGVGTVIGATVGVAAAVLAPTAIRSLEENMIEAEKKQRERYLAMAGLYNVDTSSADISSSITSWGVAARGAVKYTAESALMQGTNNLRALQTGALKKWMAAPDSSINSRFQLETKAEGYADWENTAKEKLGSLLKASDPLALTQGIKMLVYSTGTPEGVKKLFLEDPTQVKGLIRRLAGEESITKINNWLDSEKDPILQKRRELASDIRAIDIQFAAAEKDVNAGKGGSAIIRAQASAAERFDKQVDFLALNPTQLKNFASVMSMDVNELLAAGDNAGNLIKAKISGFDKERQKGMVEFVNNTYSANKEVLQEGSASSGLLAGGKEKAFRKEQVAGVQVEIDRTRQSMAEWDRAIVGTNDKTQKELLIKEREGFNKVESELLQKVVDIKEGTYSIKQNIAGQSAKVALLKKDAENLWNGGKAGDEQRKAFDAYEKENEILQELHGNLRTQEDRVGRMHGSSSSTDSARLKKEQDKLGAMQATTEGGNKVVKGSPAEVVAQQKVVDTLKQEMADKQNGITFLNQEVGAQAKIVADAKTLAEQLWSSERDSEKQRAAYKAYEKEDWKLLKLQRDVGQKQIDIGDIVKKRDGFQTQLETAEKKQTGLDAAVIEAEKNTTELGKKGYGYAKDAANINKLNIEVLKDRIGEENAKITKTVDNGSYEQRTSKERLEKNRDMYKDTLDSTDRKIAMMTKEASGLSGPEKKRAVEEIEKHKKHRDETAKNLTTTTKEVDDYDYRTKKWDAVQKNSFSFGFLGDAVIGAARAINPTVAASAITAFSAIEAKKGAAVTENIKALTKDEQALQDSNNVLTGITGQLMQKGAIQQKAAWLGQDPMMAVSSMHQEVGAKAATESAKLLSMLVKMAQDNTNPLKVEIAKSSILW